MHNSKAVKEEIRNNPWSDNILWFPYPSEHLSNSLLTRKSWTFTFAFQLPNNLRQIHFVGNKLILKGSRSKDSMAVPKKRIFILVDTLFAIAINWIDDIASHFQDAIKSFWITKPSKSQSTAMTFWTNTHTDMLK